MCNVSRFWVRFYNGSNLHVGTTGSHVFGGHQDIRSRHHSMDCDEASSFTEWHEPFSPFQIHFSKQDGLGRLVLDLSSPRVPTQTKLPVAKFVPINHVNYRFLDTALCSRRDRN
jgi:hypothetical protein